MRFLLLLLGVFTIAAAETCPPNDDISPCTCEEFDDSPYIIVSCAEPSITLAQLKQVLKALGSKTDIFLDLQRVKLGTVPHDFFEGVAIHKLEIRQCELDSLTDGRGPMLKGLEDSLQGLDITASFTENNVPAKLSLSHLHKLETLDLMHNTIMEIGNDWFQNGPTSLAEVVISDNEIQKIGDKVFGNLENLESLSLTGNRFGDIMRNMLPDNAHKLNKLELDNNALTGIPEDLFVRMPVLETVSLQNNGITRLEKGTWYSAMQNLQETHLEGNPLECDDHMNWLFRKDVNAKNMFGTCQSPESRQGMKLMDFIDQNRQKD